MNEKAKLEYVEEYTDEEGNLLQEEDVDRDNYDLECSACGCFVVTPNCLDDAEYFIRNWSYCPMCGARFEKE